MRQSTRAFQSSVSILKPVPPYLIAILTIALWNLAPSAIAAAARTTTHIHTISVPADTYRGIVSVQVRRAFEKLGATVTYTAPPAAVAVQRAGKSLLTLLVGSHAITVNGKPQLSENVPFNAHGRVIIPLSLVKQATHATTLFNPRSHTARISELVTVVVAAQHIHTTEADIVATPQDQFQGIAWWVWLILALILLGAAIAYLRRRSQPLIHTTGTGIPQDPNIPR